MFNIGGQGQYIVGTVVAVWLGTSLRGPAGGAPRARCIVGAMLAGALWAGIAGFLKATDGAHEVITTIMLNWIAIWVASYLMRRRSAAGLRTAARRRSRSRSTRARSCR